MLFRSPKTPYRYFKDKAEILATVRAQAFARFADALEAAAGKGPDDPVARAKRVGDAYHRFARENPHAYRIMFEIDAPVDDKHPELGPAAEHATRFITRGAEELVAAGAMDVDPKLFGYTMWAGMHGIVMLHQSGMLSHGPDYQALAYFLGLTMLKGAGARMAAAPAKRTAGRQKK